MKIKITLIALAMITTCMMANGQSSLKVVENGNVGVNTDNPIEKLQVNGGINLGNTNIKAAGSIRWTGEDFEGFDGLDWKSLTKCDCEVVEDGSSSNNQDDQSEDDQDSGTEKEEDQDDSNSDDQISEAGCESTNDIMTSAISLKQDWSNQLNTNGMGFSGEGKVCYTVSGYEGNTTQMMGLSEDPDEDTKYEKMNYAFYHRIVSTYNSHRVYIWENNERMGIFINSQESYAGSTFCIKRNQNSEVQYYIDDELVYTSATKSNEDLYFDNSFYGYSEGSSSIWSHQPSNIELTGIAVCANNDAGLISDQVKVSSLQESISGILNQNFPNPFTDNSRIGYDLTGEIYNSAELVVTNNIGQVLQRNKLKNQRGEIKIKGSGLSSGVYQYTVFLDSVVMESRQMVVE